MTVTAYLWIILVFRSADKTDSGKIDGSHALAVGILRFSILAGMLLLWWKVARELDLMLLGWIPT